MDNRELIIKRAHDMLSKIGPTAMTMDMVARTCGISKRTLYETFPDKKTLIMECIAEEHRMHHNKATQIFREADNVFEALFKVFQDTRHYNNKQSQAIYDQIIRLYPDVKESHRQDQRLFIDKLSLVLEQAQSQQLVINAVDTHIAAFMFITLMQSLHRNNDIEAMGFDFARVYDAAFINFLRGIASDKGREIIEQSVKRIINVELS